MLPRKQLKCRQWERNGWLRTVASGKEPSKPSTTAVWGGLRWGSRCVHTGHWFLDRDDPVLRSGNRGCRTRSWHKTSSSVQNDAFVNENTTTTGQQGVVVLGFQTAIFLAFKASPHSFDSRSGYRFQSPRRSSRWIALDRRAILRSLVRRP